VIIMGVSFMAFFFTTSMVCLCRLSWKLKQRGERQRGSGGGGGESAWGEEDSMDLHLDVEEGEMN